MNDDAAALVLDPVTGEPVVTQRLRLHLGMARTTRVSQDANSGVCRGMLLARYPSDKTAEGQEITP